MVGSLTTQVVLVVVVRPGLEVLQRQQQVQFKVMLVVPHITQVHLVLIIVQVEVAVVREELEQVGYPMLLVGVV